MLVFLETAENKVFPVNCGVKNQYGTAVPCLAVPEFDGCVVYFLTYLK